MGAVVETWTAMEIFKRLHYLPVMPGVYHFRTSGGAELDLLLEYNGALYPIEIKHTSQPKKRDLGGFTSLKECFPNENIMPGLLICAVEKPRYLREDVIAVPWWCL